MSVREAELFEQLISTRIPDDEDRIIARIAFKYGVVGHVVRFLYVIWQLVTSTKIETATKLEDGGTYAIKVEHSLDPHQVECFSRSLKETYPNIKFIVLDSSVNIVKA